MKPEIRILGIDDGSFSRTDKETIIVGVVLRGNSDLEGILCDRVKVDGFDSTSKISKMINKSKHRRQLKAIMIHGTTLAGFNLIDIKEVYKRTKIPVLGIVRKKPNGKEVMKVLEKLSNKSKREKIIKNCGEVYTYRKLYFQMNGLKLHEAYQIIDKSLKRGNFPEPIRLAHLIASGITKGESHGRA